MDSMPSAWPPPWNQYRRQNDSDAPAARREPDIADRASPEAPAATASAASQPIQIPNSIAAESSFCTPPPAPSEAAAAATAAGSVPLPPSSGLRCSGGGGGGFQRSGQGGLDEGLPVVRKLENVLTDKQTNRPRLPCVVKECGEM
ncbi:hypothetical protein PLESTB_001535600 [Pleodorina starrii]|uniref:Uncharacterized protein n=1 Tax=Pleodorina starrii TaxID=330485 RepID=A0A9W6BWF9_9CHLO|nr:hypothetical protein PLESTB_001535600 [Pleodorina starrii]GLC67330.1 hypothetical protein PLESTF_000543200 [Pleodorina starrii]